MTVLPNMGLVLPTRGAPGAGVWDDTIDANYGREDAHDHSTGKGVRVPTAGININADLSFSSLYAPTALHRVTFAQIAALASNNQSIFVSDGTGGLTAGELYWRTNAGVNVKLTSGSALNVAAFVGGIGGDYTAASALLLYDSATLSYWLQQPGSPRPWARLRTGDVDIYQTAASIVNRVRLQSPAALAASYAITLPAALPGSTQLVQMDSSGVLTASNTVPNAVALSSSLAVGATLGVTGLITATAGVTAAANQHITTSGTGDYKHGPREITVPAGGFTQGVTGSTATLSSDYSKWTLGTVLGSPNIVAWLPFRVGDRITTIVWEFDKAGSATALTMTLSSQNARTMTARDTLSDVTSGSGFVTVTRSSINYTLVTNDAMVLLVQNLNASHALSRATITYDHP